MQLIIIIQIHIAKYVYIRDKTLWNTLKGELFVAENKNNKFNGEPVCIKKMAMDINRFKMNILDIRDDINYNDIFIADSIIKESLLLRHLKTKNKLFENSIVKYIDFFRNDQYCYPVIKMDFSLNVIYFVDFECDF